MTWIWPVSFSVLEHLHGFSWLPNFFFKLKLFHFKAQFCPFVVDFSRSKLQYLFPLVEIINREPKFKIPRTPKRSSSFFSSIPKKIVVMACASLLSPSPLKTPKFTQNNSSSKISNTSGLWPERRKRSTSRKGMTTKIASSSSDGEVEEKPDFNPFGFVTDNPSSRNAIQLPESPAEDGNVGQMLYVMHRLSLFPLEVGFCENFKWKPIYSLKS